MSITGKQIIGYGLSQQGSREFHGINASTGEVVGPIFYEATTDEVDAAFILAKSAFSTYRKISDLDRAQFLMAIVDEINAIGDDLIKTACAESRPCPSRPTTLTETRFISKANSIRSKRYFWGKQFPISIFRGRWRYHVGPSRWLSCRF